MPLCKATPYTVLSIALFNNSNVKGGDDGRPMMYDEDFEHFSSLNDCFLHTEAPRSFLFFEHCFYSFYLNFLVLLDREKVFAYVQDLSCCTDGFEMVERIEVLLSEDARKNLSPTTQPS